MKIIQHKSILLAGILVMAGFGLRSTHELGYFHEAAHFMVATWENVPAKIVSETKTEVKTLTPAIVYAGYYWEVILWGLLSIFLIKLAENHLGFFFVGIFAQSVIEAPTSADFTIHASNLGPHEGWVIGWYALAIGVGVLLLLCVFSFRSGESLEDE